MSALNQINNKKIKNKNKNSEKKPKKLAKSVKAIKSRKSVPNCDCRAMNRLSTSSAPPLSPPLRTKSKPHLLSPKSMSTTEDDINDMPVLTPEVPFELELGPPVLEKCVKQSSPEPNYVDLLAPPVLSPALDEHLKPKSGNSCLNKPKKKRKLKCEVPSGVAIDGGINESIDKLSDYNFDNVFISHTKSPKKLKSSPKKSKPFELNKTKKFNKNIFGEKPIKLGKELNQSVDQNSRKLFKMFNNKSKTKSKLNFKCSPIESSNGWSVHSNHTMSSVNSSMQTSQPFMKCTNFDETNTNGMDSAQNESLLAHNSSIFDNSFKFRQKLIKKSKTNLNNSLSMRAESNKTPNKSLFNELIGVQKPTPEVDEIEGIRFLSFETEDSINLFSKFEHLEKEQKEQSSLSKTFQIKSLKSGKLIFPTKTKDITKIKGWREKLFSSLDSKNSYRSFGLSDTCSDKIKTNDKTFKSLINPMIGQSSSSGSKSAFVSDLLDGYLKTKSDLKMNYLSPDFAAPPDDSPIFSASVLKMPDFGPHSSMPPPLTPGSPHSSMKKKNIFKTKGMKNKTTFNPMILESFESVGEDDVRERLLPQYPVISETLWPDLPLSEERMSRLYNDFIEFTHNEMQQMKRPTAPSLVMDDNYARFALSALQCNQRITFTEDSDQSDNVLMAVGLAPKQRTPSPVKETKITGRYRKDREADLAKIIAMGNRSKRQIRLPSRFHESSLLMGNQWIIPDYDSKGKTGKRRLLEEQRRLQELHQKQLEIDQRRQPVVQIESIPTTTDDKQLSLIHKKLSNGTKAMKFKSKLNQLNIPSVPKEYQLKIPLIRDRKKSPKHNSEPSKLDKGFTSIFSMSTPITGDKRVVSLSNPSTGDKRVCSLSAKAAASANQRAQVNQLFLQLSEQIHPDKNSLICRNGKLNKLETIKDAIETIEKLTKREQQLSYIRKLLSMWNHKLQLCSKVAQKDLKPDARKVVSDVMNTYKNSMCYKVGEALEAKRKEFQEKRAQQLAQQSASESSVPSKKPQLSTVSQLITIPSANTSKTIFKKPSKVTKYLPNQRLILPKLPILSKNLKTIKPKPETVVNSPNIYPKLMTPELLQKSVSDSSVDIDLIGREASLLKPPILTTRPTVLKPFSIESLHTSTSVSGPVINYPDISKIKSMSKSLNSSSSSLIAPQKSHTNPSINSTPINSGARLKLPFTGSSIGSSSLTSSMASNSHHKTSTPFNPNLYSSKNMIITTPSDMKSVPVRLNNTGMAILVPKTPKSVPKTSSIVTTTPTIIGSAPALIRRGNSSESKDETKSQKQIKSQSFPSTLNLSQNIVNKSLGSHKQKVSPKSDPTDCIEID